MLQFQNRLIECSRSEKLWFFATFFRSWQIKLESKENISPQLSHFMCSWWSSWELTSYCSPHASMVTLRRTPISQNSFIVRNILARPIFQKLFSMSRAENMWNSCIFSKSIFRSGVTLFHCCLRMDSIFINETKYQLSKINYMFFCCESRVFYEIYVEHIKKARWAYMLIWLF